MKSRKKGKKIKRTNCIYQALTHQTDYSKPMTY